MARKLYDPRCEDLARHFLGTKATELLVQSLAFRIQQEIECWMIEKQQEAEMATRREND